MVFGSCCYLKNDRLSSMKAKSVKIEGNQAGLIVNFEVTQTFIHSEPESKEIHYVFPNDLKLCIYDTTFVVGDEIIKPKLQSKEEAKKTYQEAVDDGRTAIFGSNIGHGMTEFKLGNLQPDTECKVILKMAFTATVTKEKTFFIKFPLDVYTPSGSTGCLDVSASDFLFKLQCDQKSIEKVTSNIKNHEFDETTKIFSISKQIENDGNQRSIILTFETKGEIESSILIGKKTNNYNCCAITISPHLPPSPTVNNEFIFLVDCSGSMRGESIKNAAECLEIFIRSLPSGSNFNIIRFGSQYEKLFESSVAYNEETSEKGINLAQSLNANLGGTNIYSPLSYIYNLPKINGQRQIFILTDGEVNNVENVLQLIRENAVNNRCFTIGIGRGCDAGLVEGMANESGGKSDFVQEGDSISEKVIPQLRSSVHPCLTNIEVHVSGSDSFEVSPFPIPSINANGSSVVYLREKDCDGKSFDNGILINGIYSNESVEIPVDEIVSLNENNTIDEAILPLFAFNVLKSYERKSRISDDEKMKAIELSISSGVLCKFTGFVGMTESSNIHRINRRIAAPGCYMSFGAAPRGQPHGGMRMCCCCAVRSRPHAAPPPPPQKAHRCVGMSVDDDDENDGFQVPGEPIKRRAEEQKNAQNESYNLMNLLRLQNIAGFWENLEVVNKMAGINVNKIDEVIVDDKVLERKCIATIIAIATVHIKSPNEKDVYSMIEEKAILWLNSNLGGIEINSIIHKIEDLIKSSK